MVVDYVSYGNSLTQRACSLHGEKAIFSLLLDAISKFSDCGAFPAVPNTERD